ncbi:Nuclear protein localization protein 4-like protein, partial [Fragariocoptes setiger]
MDAVGRGWGSTLKPTVKLDPIDEYLSQQSGLIRLPPEKTSCRHTGQARCLNCMPLQPFDQEYLASQNIKHMSFHAYLRKLTQGVDKGKYAPLENISCRIKPIQCKGHKPWPEGICTKCQPSAITLNRQQYRHVDNIMFENPAIVDNFLNYWRTTGHQRYGLLYGYYTPHENVPLGIKANVVAIYEPPQKSSRDHLEMSEDPQMSYVEETAKLLGLQVVGWIFTDLIAKDVHNGTVEHLRKSDTFFLSAHECIAAGHFQNIHTNPCNLSTDGYFGSKFATVCVTGDKNNQIHMEGYQVSNQCMALVREHCLLPTLDAPELGYVRESGNGQYVPDVYYKITDKYKNEVTQLARPLPIEYLLVDVPVATPLTPTRRFNPLPDKKLFPPENRQPEQDFSALHTYLSQFDLNAQFIEAISDFHLLLYLGRQEIVPMREALRPLLEAMNSQDKLKILSWRECEQWRTIEELIN